MNNGWFNVRKHSKLDVKATTRFVSCSSILVILLGLSLRIFYVIFVAPFATWNLFIPQPATNTPPRHPRLLFRIL